MMTLLWRRVALLWQRVVSAETAALFQHPVGRAVAGVVPDSRGGAVAVH